MKGMLLTTEDNLAMTTSNTYLGLDDCSVTFTGSADLIQLSQNGAHLDMVNTDLIWSVGTTGSQAFLPSNSSMITMVGGSLQATTGSLDDVVGVASTGGGHRVTLDGVDLSDNTGYMLGNVGGSYSSDDLIQVRIRNCKLGSVTGHVEEAFTSGIHYYECTGSAATSAAAEYQYFIKTWTGEVEDSDNAGINRRDGTAFDGGQYVSLMVTANSNASISTPFIFKLPSTFVPLSAAGTDNIRIHLTSETALTHSNCWVEARYPDRGNKHVHLLKSSRSTDILSTGTALTTDGASDWQKNSVALAACTEYYIDIDTSGTGDEGDDGVPELTMYVAVDTSAADKQIYVDTSYTLS